MFRSEDVALYSVTTDGENVWELLNLLGNAEMVMIEQSATSVLAEKSSASKIRRLEEWKQRLDAFKFKSAKFGKHAPPLQLAPGEVERLVEEKAREHGLRQPMLLEKMLQKAERKIRYFDECHANFDIIVSNIVDLVKTKAVLANVFSLMPRNFG